MAVDEAVGLYIGDGGQVAAIEVVEELTEPGDQIRLGEQDVDGHPHTDKLQMTTRIQRPDFGHLEFETTYEDAGTFTKPWKVRQVADLAPGEEIWEYICNENNQDAEHMVGK